MKFDIEKFHVIYKNLIRMGKDLDAESFRTILESKGFKREERVIPTPTGPLKEYLLRDPRNLRDLIVVSVKGFVVDSWNHTNAIDLASIAYEAYESVLGDAISYMMVDIIGMYDITLILNSDSFKLIEGLVNSTFINKVRATLDRKDVHAFSAGFSLGEPRPPHEWVVVNLIPIADPNAGRSGRRLKMLIEYRGVDSDKGVKFLQDFPDFIKKITKALSS